VYYAVAAALLLVVGVQVGRRLESARQMADVTKPAPPAAPRDSLGGTRQDSVQRTQPNDAVVPTTPDQRLAAVDRTDNGGANGRPRPRPSGPERQSEPDAGDDVTARAYTVASAQHLTEAEAMLTAFKGDLSQGRLDADISAWGKDLLSNTRLLLDSPAANDPTRRKLLQDLELVLVQIVQLSPKSSARDRDLIKGALTDDQVLTRLRIAIPVKGT
jgi:hypothetical protein